MSPNASPSDALPMPWVARIFARLSVRYGRAFLARWDGLAMELVHADWAEQLAGLDRRSHAIAYALAHLPIDKPPTVGEFKALCNACPDAPMPALPAPAADPARVAAAMAQCRGPRGATLGSRKWAERLRDRELAGDHLPMFSQRAWRVALRVMPDDSLQTGDA